MTAVVGTEPRRRVLIRLFDALGRGRERLGLGDPPLSASRLLRRVRRRTKLEDLGEGPVEEALGILTSSLQHEAQCRPFGRHVARKMLALALERRLKIVDLVKRTPEVRAQRIQRPLFIAALPRTGTTLLYNLLAQDPRARPLLSWEAYHPLPPRGPFRGRLDPRRLQHAQGVRVLDWMAPDLQRIHPVTATGPEECIPLLLRTFLTGAWSMFADIPSYDAWVRSRPSEDHLAAYAFHRDQLRVIQWQRPAGDAWLLKSPAHTLALPALLRTYPDAIVVRTHRDLLKVLPSTCSLFRAARSIVAGPVDTRALGRFVMRMAEDILDRVAAPLPPDVASRVLDVRYADLVADPRAVVSRIQEAAGREITPGMEAAMDRYLAANPRHKKAVHRYTLEEYGLDRGEVEALAAPYHDRFDVPREGTVSG